jgi:hypothetical protein
MMSKHVPHHGVPLGHMVTGAMVHQDNAVSELHRVQAVLNATQLDVLKHVGHIANLNP